MSMLYMKPGEIQFMIEVLEAPSGLSPVDTKRALRLAADLSEQLIITRSRPRKPQRTQQEPTHKGNLWLPLTPDWSTIWTAPESEAQLEGFTFKGPGWYLTETDSMLVKPDSSRPILQNWTSKRLPGEHFHFLVWNNSNPCATFNNIVNAPVKVDTRPLHEGGGQHIA